MDYIKVSEVAKVFSVSINTVKKWCVNGDIEATRIGGTWFIKREAIEPSQSELKPKRVVALEKQNKALQDELEALQSLMRNIAGTLLERSN